jgi:hypothetical protein
MRKRRQPHFLRVGGVIVAVGLFASLLSPYDPGPAPPMPSDYEEAFDEVFEYVRSIEIPDEAPAILAGVDLDRGVRLLLLEPRSDVVLLDGIGGAHTSLGDHACSDGTAWTPRAARFAPDGSIVVLNGGAAYRFTTDGQCTGPMNPAFSPPGPFDILEDGRLVAYHFLPPPPMVTVHDSTGRLLHSTIIEVDRVSLNGRISSGSIAGGDGWVFVSRPLIPRLLRTSADGGDVSDIGWRPRTYRTYTGHDIPPGSFDENSFDPRLYIYRSTISKDVMYVGDSVILHQHANQYRHRSSANRYSISLMDTNGEPLTRVQLYASTPFVASRDGYLFRWDTNVGRDRPRRIQVYRIS